MMCYICPYCGAHLDSISEVCDCEEEDTNANLVVQKAKLDPVEAYYNDWYAC